MIHIDPAVSNETVMDSGAVLRAFAKRGWKLGIFVVGTGVILAVLFGQWPSLETDLSAVAAGMLSALLLGTGLIMSKAILTGEAYVVRPHRLTAAQNIEPASVLDVRSPLAMDPATELAEPNADAICQESRIPASDTVEPGTPGEDDIESVEQTELTNLYDQSIGLRSLSAVAQRVVARSKDQPCCIVLAAGTCLSIDATPEVLQIARETAAAKVGTVIVDLGDGTIPLSSTLGLPRSPGLTELLAGTAGFDSIIKRDPQSTLQFIAAGKPRGRAQDDVAYGLDRIIDTLGHVYGCVILFADPATAKSLQNQLQDQLTIGLEFTDGKCSGGTGTVSEFLGEPPAGLQIIRYTRPDRQKTGLLRSLLGVGAAA